MHKINILPFLCLISVAVCKITVDYTNRNNQFAVDLIQELSKNHSHNVFYNSLSIETLLELILLEAKGKTAEQIRQALYLPQSDEKIKEQVRSLAEEFDKANYTLPIVNEIFLAKDIEAESNFKNISTQLFRTQIRNVDFGKPKDALKTMNSWISEQTDGKITDLVKEEQFNNFTRMILASAIDFKGNFEHPFKPEDTKMDFHLTKNETVKVETMKLTENLSIFSSTNQNVTFLFIPYAGTDGRLKFGIMIPDDVEEAEELEFKMKHAIPERINNFQKTYATIYLPKFKVETTLDLKPTLKNMGITELFSSPDLSGITNNSLTVDTIIQKIIFNVDEIGTDPVGPVAGNNSHYFLPIAKPEPKEYRIDKPFYFGVDFDDVAIINGRMMNPLEENIN